MNGVLMLSTRAGVSGRQVRNFTKLLKNVNILEYHEHIWYHHVKCIQMRPNMPDIVSLIREIDVKI